MMNKTAIILILVFLSTFSYSQNQSIPYTKAKYVFPLCIVIGNEVDGVSQEIVENADQSIEIPMFGLKQSLNVSVAYGTVLYHILDQYNRKNVLKA